VILHRDDGLVSHQVFFYDQWGSGLYAHGHRRGADAAPIVAAWPSASTSASRVTWRSSLTFAANYGPRPPGDRSDRRAPDRRGPIGPYWPGKADQVTSTVLM